MIQNENQASALDSEPKQKPKIKAVTMPSYKLAQQKQSKFESAEKQTRDRSGMILNENQTSALVS